MQARLTSANDPEEIKYMINKFLDQDPGLFNYPKPADFQTTA